MFFYIINGINKTIEQQASSLTEDQIKSIIGHPSIDSDELNAQNDYLYFDESCFIRQTNDAGRFQYKNLAPLAGVAIITGKNNGGFTSPSLTLENIKANIRFL
jgi:hypothetical protein